MHETPPPGLAVAGTDLWHAVTGAFELSAHELLLLKEAARTADLLDALEALVAQEGPVTESPQGQRANPAAVEARQQRIVLARLVAALRIPEAEDQAGAGRPQRRPLRGVHRVRGA